MELIGSLIPIVLPFAIIVCLIGLGNEVIKNRK